MSALVRIALATIVFWAIWTGVAGLAATIHGDCGIGATELEAASCVEEKRWLGLAVLALGAIPYVLIVRRLARRAPDRDR